MGLEGVSHNAWAVAVAVANRAGSSNGLAWPGFGTLAKDARLSRPAVMRAVKELEQGGHLTVTRLKIGKKNASNRYRLPAVTGSSETPPSVCETPPPSVCEIPEPVRTLEPVKKAAARSIRDTDSGKAETVKPDRHTCPCGNSWPREYGTVCYSPSCNQPKGSTHNAGMAAPEPGKYDGLWDDAPGVNRSIDPLPQSEAPEDDAPVPSIQEKYIRNYAAAHPEKTSRRRQYERSDGSFTELPGGLSHFSTGERGSQKPLVSR